MAVSYVAVNNAVGEANGLVGASTVAITPTLPAGTAMGDRVFILQGHSAASSAATPAGWTALFKDVVVGTGAVATGAGQRLISCYYRDYDALWVTPSFALTSAANLSHWIGAVTLRKAISETWATPTFINSVTFAAAATAFTSTSGSFATVANAMLMAFTLTNDTPSTATVPTITGTNGFTHTGVTERADGGDATGFDAAGKIHTAIVNAAASPAGTLTHAMTLSAASQGGVSFVQQTVTQNIGPQLASVGTRLANSTIAATNIAVPAGVTANDIILAFIFKDPGTAQVSVMPAGFTQLVTDAFEASNVHSEVFWKRATGNDSGTYDFTLSTTSTTRTGIALRFASCETFGSPVDTYDSESTATGTTAFPDTNLVTTGVNRLLVWWGGCFAGTASPPAGFEVVYNSTGAGAIMLAIKYQAAPGASGTISAVSSATNSKTVFLGALELLVAKNINNPLSVAVNRAVSY